MLQHAMVDGLPRDLSSHNRSKFVEREYRFNCLKFASANCHKIGRCFIEVASRQIVGSRQIVERFVSTCQSAATCDLWTRVTTLCNALDNALLQLNMATDGKYRDLEHCIFSRPVTESYPPKQRKHRAYLGPRGLDLDFMRMSLTEQMDDIISTAMDLLSAWPL